MRTLHTGKSVTVITTAAVFGVLFSNALAQICVIPPLCDDQNLVCAAACESSCLSLDFLSSKCSTTITTTEMTAVCTCTCPDDCTPLPTTIIPDALIGVAKVLCRGCGYTSTTGCEFANKKFQCTCVK